MNIEELLNKYFEGETTCEEERELRRFFTRGIVPEHLQMYRPMFAFLNEENRQSKTAVPEVPKFPPDRSRNADRKSTRLNSSHASKSRMPSSA